MIRILRICLINLLFCESKGMMLFLSIFFLKFRKVFCSFPFFHQICTWKKQILIWSFYCCFFTAVMPAWDTSYIPSQYETYLGWSPDGYTLSQWSIHFLELSNEFILFSWILMIWFVSFWPNYSERFAQSTCICIVSFSEL